MSRSSFTDSFSLPWCRVMLDITPTVYNETIVNTSGICQVWGLNKGWAPGIDGIVNTEDVGVRVKVGMLRPHRGLLLGGHGLELGLHVREAQACLLPGCLNRRGCIGRGNWCSHSDPIIPPLIPMRIGHKIDSISNRKTASEAVFDASDDWTDCDK